jgi:hypothetical protein
VIGAIFENMRGKTPCSSNIAWSVPKMLIQLVMSHRQIVKHGSHDQFIEISGPYRRLWDLQNQIMVEVEDANI